VTVRADLDKVVGLVSPAASSQACSIHKGHQPDPLYTEQHHVIPQAWQHSAAAMALGLTADASQLFDPRTVPLCRTGHGNVHFVLVRLTRFFAEKKLKDPADVREAETFVDELATKALKGVKHGKAELEVAKLGLVRWLAAGGTLKALTDEGQWGAI
jgi:hypothetical protein